MYKIFSKFLANRLKKILPKIISEHQNAFTKSKLIYDNILVAFETSHSMQKHNRKDDFMAIKLGMSKTYDRMECSYLKAVMRRMGFGEQWIKLMMVCVKTVSYSILVNSKPKGIIIQPMALDKRIHFLLPFFCCVLKVYMASSLKRQFWVI